MTKVRLVDIEVNGLIHPQVVGRQRNSQTLKPTSAWESTGKVEPGTSGHGCAVKCIYCNQIAMDSTDKGENTSPYLSGMVDGGLSINTRLFSGSTLDMKISLDALMIELKQWPLYTPESPVILENFNDPGNDWEATGELAVRLVKEMGHTGPIVFITKMGIGKKGIEALISAKEQGAKLIGIVTYSNMPIEIEPSSSKTRLSTMKKLKNAGIPVIVSMRPMIDGINASEENIDLVLKEVDSFADFIIVGGLFVFEQFTIDVFLEAGYPLGPEYLEQIYSPAKRMHVDYRTIVRNRAKELGTATLVHDHTSCAISNTMTASYGQPTSDRFAHWINSNGLGFDGRCSHCPKEQMALCKKDSSRDIGLVIQDAQDALLRLGYENITIIESVDVPNTILLEGTVLTFEELTTIKEKCRWYVDNLPNYQGMKHRINEALVNELRIDPNLVIVDMVLVGQEWHIFVKKTSVGDDSYPLIERWIRSYSRHRVRVIAVEDICEVGINDFIASLVEKNQGIQNIEDLSLKASIIYNYSKNFVQG